MAYPPQPGYPQYQPPQPPPPPQHSVNKNLLIGGGIAAVVLILLGALSAVVGDERGRNTPMTAGPATETVTVAPSTAGDPVDKSSPTPKPKPVVMPNVVGKNGSIARRTLTGLGISLSDIEMASGDPDAQMVLLPQNWKVTDQEPRAGAKVQPGDLVVLTLVKLA